jgi:hypothetical protein
MPSFRASPFALMILTLAGCSDAVAPRAAAPLAVDQPDLAVTASAPIIVRFPVSFTMPGGTCGLTTTVTATGDFQMVNRVSQTRSGEWRVGFSWSAHGTAVGADGSQYRFNYSANGKWIDVVDPTSLPVEIELVDHFNLIGQGGAPDVRVFLHGRFLYDGATVTPIGTPVIRGAGLACDPI